MSYDPVKSKYIVAMAYSHSYVEPLAPRELVISSRDAIESQLRQWRDNLPLFLHVAVNTVEPFASRKPYLPHVLILQYVHLKEQGRYKTNGVNQHVLPRDHHSTAPTVPD